MKIYFVRHGHPDYKNDCLTELGHRHAQAAAIRLKDSDIRRVYSSSKGRAMETAAYTAKQFGLEVIPCDFIREIGWKSINDEPIPENGHPWRCSNELVRMNERLMREDWQNLPLFHNNKVLESYKEKAAQFDEFLADLGYTREGDYYRVGKPKYNRIMIVSHAGSSSVAISHALNLPFPYFCRVFSPDLTGITVVNFPGNEGELSCPTMSLFGDARHIAGIDCEKIISR